MFLYFTCNANVHKFTLDLFRHRYHVDHYLTIDFVVFVENLSTKSAQKTITQS